MPDLSYMKTDTGHLWEKLQNEIYDVYIIDTVAKAHETNTTKISYSPVSVKENILLLAKRCRKVSIFNCNDINIYINIATALICNCDFYVSWDYKHIVNTCSIRGTKVMAMLEGLKDIIICTPTMLIQ